MTSFKFPMPPLAHSLMVCITQLELMISCWMWLVISELWVFPSQLPYKPCHGENPLLSPSASPMGPSSAPWARAWVPVPRTAVDSLSALVMTRTYLLASPRGHPGQQTQREKNPNSFHSLPTAAPKESRWCLLMEVGQPAGLSGEMANTPVASQLTRGMEEEMRQGSPLWFCKWLLFLTFVNSHNPAPPQRPSLSLSFSD